MITHYISLDVGGTHCRVGLMEKSDNGKLKILQQKKLGINQNFEAGVQELAQHIKDTSKGFTIHSIGASFPGLVDLAAGSVRVMTNLPQWEGKPIKAKLEELLQIKTVLLHDVASAAMGEAIYGSAVGVDNFVFFIWGTGVGGTKVEKLAGKYHITSFEPGHHIVERNGIACDCGSRGCPELTIGGGSLERRVGKPLATLTDDDPLWQEVIEVASQTVINTLAFHQTRLIIFGGGLILKRPFLLEKISEKIARLKQTVFLPAELKLAKLGDDAALYGAVALQEVELV